MIWWVAFPGTAFVTMFVVGVIIVLLRYGPRICGVRHHAVPDINEWEEGRAYDQRVSTA